MWKRITTIILLVLLGAAAVIFWPESAQLDGLDEAAAAYDVQILRDDWGVPHVFGVTDADVVLGTDG
jgi:acyl-homoserine-lactone acylase